MTYLNLIQENDIFFAPLQKIIIKNNTVELTSLFLFTDTIKTVCFLYFYLIVDLLPFLPGITMKYELKK